MERGDSGRRTGRLSKGRRSLVSITKAPGTVAGFSRDGVFCIRWQVGDGMPAVLAIVPLVSLGSEMVE